MGWFRRHHGHLTVWGQGDQAPELPEQQPGLQPESCLQRALWTRARLVTKPSGSGSIFPVTPPDSVPTPVLHSKTPPARPGTYSIVWKDRIT
jgi:hypothetical protein